MLIPTTILPRAVPIQRMRLPQGNIPQTASERERLKALIARYVEDNRDSLVPPLVIDELRRHAEDLVRISKSDPIH